MQKLEPEHCKAEINSQHVGERGLESEKTEPLDSFLPSYCSLSLLCISLGRSFCAATLAKNLGKVDLERQHAGNICVHRNRKRGREARQTGKSVNTFSLSPTYDHRSNRKYPGAQMPKVGKTGRGWEECNAKVHSPGGAALPPKPKLAGKHKQGFLFPSSQGKHW